LTNRLLMTNENHSVQQLADNGEINHFINRRATLHRADDT